MPPPGQAPVAAKPTKAIFDPFNSSATGHQRAENRLSGSVSWRDSRNRKLQEQFTSGAGGGKRLSDTVGAGSRDFGEDGRTANGGWVKGAKGLRQDGQKSILDGGFSIHKSSNQIGGKEASSLARPTKVVNPFTPFVRDDGKIRESSWTGREHIAEGNEDPTSKEAHGQHNHVDRTNDVALPRPRLIFDNVTVYINGSTGPTVSDHKLKHLLSENGGRLSIALGRRSVTHVVIGKPNTQGGSGGGLAGSKIQKEITRVGGKGIKYVSPEWIIESVRAGKRLPESRFESLHLGPRGVAGAAAMFGSRNASKTEHSEHVD